MQVFCQGLKGHLYSKLIEYTMTNAISSLDQLIKVACLIEARQANSSIDMAPCIASSTWPARVL
jgi:hypothetical protein